uniref:Class I SAM-dependent methyltransferase n=1 Tax=candidate division WOR-3 bacterium TaxID=2052148 RepID=A0A7V3KNB6_UNCW3
MSRSEVYKADHGFYDALRKRGWTDIIPTKKKEKRDWNEILKTKEDAVKIYQENFGGMSRKEVRKADPGFYDVLQRRGWKDIIPTKERDWNEILKTKEDAVKIYQEKFAGMIRNEVHKADSGFYDALRKRGWTNIIPTKKREERNWEEILKTKEDAVKYYQENFDGMSRYEVEKADPGYYETLRKRGWTDIIPTKNREWEEILKTKDDAVKYYQENFDGMSRYEVQKADPGYYKALWKRGWRDIIPVKEREKRDWNEILKTKEDAVKIYQEKFPGMIRNEVHKADPGFYDALRKRGWTDIIPGKRDILGKNLRDYSKSSLSQHEIGDLLIGKHEIRYPPQEKVKKLDFGAKPEEQFDYISKEEASGADSQVLKLLRLLEEQNNKSKATELSYTDRPELVQLYNAGISCTETSAVLLYSVFDTLNSNGRKVETVLDLGGAHGCASIKAKNEFEKKKQKELELTIVDMDETGIKIAQRAASQSENVKVIKGILPHKVEFPEKSYDLITATYFFNELTCEEIKQTIQIIPESKYIFATLPPSKKEKTETVINSLEINYDLVRYGLFPVTLTDVRGRRATYTVTVIGGTKM